MEIFLKGFQSEKQIALPIVSDFNYSLMLLCCTYYFYLSGVTKLKVANVQSVSSIWNRQGNVNCPGNSSKDNFGSLITGNVLARVQRCTNPQIFGTSCFAPADFEAFITKVWIL